MKHWSQLLVPEFILHNLASDVYDGEFSAASLFVDISGFTALTETLLQEGTIGAEVLANTVQEIFDPLIEQIYIFGGFVSGFAGDAFYALFPGEQFQSCQNAVNAASGIRRHMLANPEQITPFGVFCFEIKMGVAFGHVNWGILEPGSEAGCERVSAYYFRGSAIEESTIAESLAQPGKIIISMQVLQILRATVTIETIGSPNFFRIRALKFPTKPPPNGKPHPDNAAHLLPNPIDPTLVNRFVPEVIRNQRVQGEFRQVLSLMINIPEPNLPGRIDEVLRRIFDLQTLYGGYLNGVMFGDKGCHILMYWGAPIGYENDIERALQFALALQKVLPFTIRGGITYQFMYAGFVGTSLQTNYACYGRGVNLASRCMEAAPWGEIWVEEQIARAHPPFELEWAGYFQFKGFGDELPVFRLSHRQNPGKTYFENDLVGRELEIDQLLVSLQPILDGKFAGITLIEGEAGLGKSRLIHTIQKRLSDCAFLVFPCGQAPAQSFAPIRSFLRSFFKLETDSPTNRTRFMSLLRRLIDTDNIALQSELSLTYSCIGALVDIYWPDSHYEQLDPQGRFQNTLIGLKALVKAETQRQPIVVVIEDAQWLDEESRKFFDYLTKNVENFPIALVITTRAGENPLTVEPVQKISLAPLNRPGLQHLIEETLRQPAHSGLINFLDTRAEGNPFFVEQILLYLRENDLLISTEDGLVHSDEIEEAILPVDVRAILTARLDGLTSEVKTVVQTASILGREFEVLVLAQMMQDDAQLMEKVEEAAKASIWSAMDQELQYLFRHTLLRDTAYNMQLLSRRQELHGLAAKSLEHLQTAGIAVQPGEIGYHYEQANRSDLAWPYFIQAGDKAAYAYQNALALTYYNRALSLIPKNYEENLFRVWLGMEKIYDLEGKRGMQKIACENLQVYAESLSDPYLLTEAALRFAHYYRATNDYRAAIQTAKKCITLSQNRFPNQEASAYVRIGHSLWLQGRYEESKENLNKAMKLTQADGFTDKKLVAEIWRNLGVVLWFMQDYEGAESHYKRALAYCQDAETRDMRGEAASLNNLGILAQTREQFDKAIAFYQRSIEVYQKAGDRQGEGNTLANLGGLAANSGDFPLAINTFHKVLSLALETSDRRGQGNAQNHLGQISMNLAQYDSAREYYRRALNIYQEINDLRGIGHIYLNSSHLALREEKPDEALRLAEQAINHVQKWHDPPTEASAWSVVGQAQTLRHQVSMAEEAFRRAEIIFNDLKSTNALMEIYAAEACLYTGKNQLTLAVKRIAPVLQHLEPVWSSKGVLKDHLLFGTRHPFQVYWRCYLVLRAIHDPRANCLLKAAQDLLTGNANRIQDDVLWRSYLQNERVHAEIMNVSL